MPSSNKVRIVVATSVALSFISFWRAAAIVLNDMGSSAFYAGSIAEQAFGKSAPWMVLGVMLFSNSVRLIYIESSAMFTRGGVYRVVKEAMGGGLAKLSAAALMFDYILTGPISGTSAGHYIVGLVNESLNIVGIQQDIPTRLGALIFALLVTAYFWRKNIIGIPESSGKALRIMYVVTVLVVLVLVWSAITLAIRGGQLPPFPTLESFHFNPHALGWLAGTGLEQIAAIAFLIAFGHSILAMSGEETLAQVYREIEHPKLKNLKRAAVVIGIFTFLFTGLGSLLAVMIVPDAERTTRYAENIISGLAMNLAGPYELRLMFQVFVVVTGTLMLAGAVNTGLVGSNGVMNRLAEDGVLTDWFRKPHPRYGTTYRMINLVALLQVLTILASRGDVFVLGEAYAFGVVWSFAMKAMSVVALRFKDPSPREWRVPLNLKLGRRELPVGIVLIALVLLATAIVNLLTKQVATIAGLIFTGILFIVFSVSERITARRHAAKIGIEHFNLAAAEQVNCDLVGCRSGNVLVAVRDENHLGHLQAVLERTDTDERDVVVMTTRLMQGGHFSDEMFVDQALFSQYEQKLFSQVVSLTEKQGKPVSLAVVPGTNPEDALMLTAQRLNSSAVAVGYSEKFSPEEKARLIGLAWERLPHPRPRITLQVIARTGETKNFLLGPHAPALRPEDVELLHRLWLELTSDPSLRRLHHDQLMSVALRRMATALRTNERDMLLAELRRIADASRSQTRR